MKVTKITCSMTRQVQQFQPAVFSMEAEVPPGADPEKVAKELQRLVIRVLYKDTAKMRDSLIASIVDCSEAPTTAQEAPQKKKIEGEPEF